MTAAFLVVLLALGTNSQPAPTRQLTAHKATTACAAVTRSDVELALGRKIGAGSEENSMGSSTCDYSAGGGQITVTIQHLGAAPDLDQEIASLKAEFPGSTVRAAAVSGATAFYLDLGSDGTLLHVIRDGRDYVLVAVLGFGAPASVSGAAASLARTALGRM